MQGGLLRQGGRQVKWPRVAFVQVLWHTVTILPSFPRTIPYPVVQVGSKIGKVLHYVMLPGGVLPSTVNCSPSYMCPEIYWLSLSTEPSDHTHHGGLQRLIAAW